MYITIITFVLYDCTALTHEILIVQCAHVANYVFVSVRVDSVVFLYSFGNELLTEQKFKEPVLKRGFATFFGFLVFKI